MTDNTRPPEPGIFSAVRHSVRKKLMLVVLVTTFVALLLMGAAMMVYDLRTYHESWVSDMSAQADLIGKSSAPALAFDDERVARENLTLLNTRPKVSVAAIYTAKGTLFASYVRPGVNNPQFATMPQIDGYRVEGNDLLVFKRIQGVSEHLGTVYLRANYELAERLQSYLVILAAVMAASLLVAIMMTSWLQSSMTQPILAMTDVARQVMTQRDFSLRVKKSTDDEIGYLVDTFNAMLGEIGRRTDAIEATNRTLEQEMGERRNAEKALLAADRQKDEFLATLAHELRNPLAPLLNALEILRLPGQDGNASLAAREMMERQLRQMVQLVNDLLDVSRITTGKMVMRKERSELSAIVRIALETAKPLMASRDHEFTVHLPDEPVHLMADEPRLAQVFVNLLNNAAKFTDPGGRIAFTAEVKESALVVSVTDNGMGISPETLPLVFEMFAQADRSLDRAHAGLGVGLSLARHLVELHGGTLVARSEGVGRGSQFTVYLPTLARVEVDWQNPPEATKSTSSKYRVLLADDNVDFADSLSTLLEASGHEVCVTNDGQAALDAAPEFKPQLCFLDIGLPRVHGYELARRLRQLPATQDAILVAVSGWGTPEDKRKASEAGFNHHLSKPVEFGQIQSLLSTLAEAQAID